METNAIKKEQLDILVDKVDTAFEKYFKSDKSKIDSVRGCFFLPEIYKEEGLWSLDKEIFRELPEGIQDKTHELIAEFTKVD